MSGFFVEPEWPVIVGDGDVVDLNEAGCLRACRYDANGTWIYPNESDADGFDVELRECGRDAALLSIAKSLQRIANHLDGRPVGKFIEYKDDEP